MAVTAAACQVSRRRSAVVYTGPHTRDSRRTASNICAAINICAATVVWVHAQQAEFLAELAKGRTWAAWGTTVMVLLTIVLIVLTIL